ncbi:MAG: protein-export chaperone SecB [Alphaproteobacteria bacterium]|nr:protein-export chaperone SecB [Alphaproteobacteria bacterium]
MSENTAKNQPQLLIKSQYIKDLSLEIPFAPEIFKELIKQPELKIDVAIESKKIDDDYNITLKLNLNSDLNGRKLFVLELSYAALVSINVPSEHIEPICVVEVPRLLFPFARNIITQCLVEGGLPPFMIAPIDFGAMYIARKNGQQ